MRKSFTLLGKNKATGDGEWIFRRKDDGMNVFDADDRLVDFVRHADANDRFAMPSFWRSIKYITYTTSKGVKLEFQPDAEDIRIVRDYLDDALMTGGSAAIAKYRTSAWLSLVGGALLFLGCLTGAFLLDHFYRPRDTPWSPRGMRVFVVGMIVGVALFGWGCAAAVRASRLMRRIHDDGE